MTQYLTGAGVQLLHSVRVTALLSANGHLTVKAAGQRTFTGKTVIIATGGASYPHSGSTGDGYALARQAGHRIVPPRPGLVPLCLAEQQLCRQLQGLTLKNIRLTLTATTEAPSAVGQGEVIFTHFGLSGPAALGLSRTLLQTSTTDSSSARRLLLDLFPEKSTSSLAENLYTLAATQPRKAVLNIFKQLMPERMAALSAQIPRLNDNPKCGELSKKVWLEAACFFKNLPFTITGTRPLAEAMVTVGGVTVKEIDPGTMASRLVDGLYFAGEVLDIDAESGGFNLQAAFSTGWTAGLAAAQKAKI